MIQIRLTGTEQEIQETLEKLSSIYEIHHSGIRKGREKYKNFICYINAAIPRHSENDRHKEADLEAEVIERRAIRGTGEKP